MELVHARRLGRRVEYTLDLAALDELAHAVGSQVSTRVASAAGAPMTTDPHPG